MLSTKSKHIRSITVAGQRAKTTVRLVREEDDTQMFVLIDKYILCDEIREDFKDMGIVKEYKGKYLYFARTAYKLETYCAIVENVHNLLKNE